MRYTLLLALIFWFTYAKSDIILEYEVLVKKEHPLVDQSQLLPQKFFMYINDDYVVVRNVGYNYMTSKYVYDRHSSQAMRCFEHGDDKLMQKFKKMNYEFSAVDNKQYAIQGYTCKKASAVVNNTKVEVYYADPYGIHFFEFGEIKGLPILFSKEHEIFDQVIYKLSRMSVGEAPDGIFETSTFEPYDEESFAKSHVFDDMVGDEAPVVSFRTMERKKREDYSWSNKITVINFWFVSCPPCIEELPLLNKLKERYAKSDKVKFLAVTFNNTDEVKDFLKKV